MAKLLKTKLTALLTYIYFNAYLMKSVYFRCGIYQLDNKQEQILKNIYENLFLWKLQLSEKMLREVLYARKKALGVGIVAPSTVIDTLTLKLYIGNKRVKNRIAGLLSIIEEM